MFILHNSSARYIHFSTTFNITKSLSKLDSFYFYLYDHTILCVNVLPRDEY